jgi:hypothetical protein
MTIRDLGPWLFAHPRFQAEFLSLLAASATGEFSGAVRPHAVPAAPDWDYLLLAASLFAGHEDVRLRDAALRIAVSALRARDVPERFRDAGGVILDVLANAPTLRMAVNQHLIATGLEHRIPMAARLEWVHRRLENQVLLDTGEDLSVNRFQRELWSAVEANQWVSFTAPTSAGKSFLLTRWVVDLLLRHPQYNVAYLVPTRALISEVEANFTARVRDTPRLKARVTSLPVPSLLQPEGGNILVVTQERLHMMLLGTEGVPSLSPESARLSSVSLDVLVVDEAHKLGDRHRGVLLQQVIERAVGANENLRVIFASPAAQNPEVLVRDRPGSTSAAVLAREEVTVSQNLLWVRATRGAPLEWTVELQWQGEPLPLGTLILPFNPGVSARKRLAFVAYAMGEHLGGNVVYVNGAADAETVAMQLYDLRAGETTVAASSQRTATAPGLAQQELDPRIRDLIQLTRRTVHERFQLATTLERGIAFHYGNMPLLIREEVERLFRIGVLRYLVCTSTLVEGVNTACRSIFVRGPQRGRGNRMSGEDFWNLAGRAGRWGLEFQGNVVCVDPTDPSWGPSGAPRTRQSQLIESTSERLLRDPAKLLDFAAAGTPRAQAAREPELEFAFAYLSGLLLTEGALTRARWARHVSPGTLEKIEQAILDARRDPLVPSWAVLRNPGFSPVAMDALLRYFRQRSGPVDELLPPLPSDEGAAERMVQIFGRIRAHLNEKIGAQQVLFARAILVTNWMRGQPLGVLISQRERYEAQRGSRMQLPAIIRAVMDDVEQIARFEAPRSVACYLDVLRVFLAERDQLELMDATLDLSLYLELGVHQTTQISLMSLGLSRTSTLAISELIADDRLDRDGARRWLENGTWVDADLPALVRREIGRVLGWPEPSDTVLGNGGTLSVTTRDTTDPT